MRQLDKSTLIDDELHDLKLRFELLEGDRKAYYETSQWAIRRNKEEVNHLRQQNKQLSDAIARIKKVCVKSRDVFFIIIMVMVMKALRIKPTC